MQLPHDDYRSVFSAMPGASCLILPDDPDFTLVATTPDFLDFAGADRETFIGSSLFRYFPDNPSEDSFSADIRKSLRQVISTKEKNELRDQQYDIASSDGIFREMYWTVIHNPILDEKGEIAFIVHTAINTTDQVLSRIKDQKIKALQLAQHVFRQTNVAIHIFKGRDLVIEMANHSTLDLWGRDETVLNKPLLEALPELEHSAYPQLIRDVMKTGKSYSAHEAEVHLNRPGKDPVGYFNFVLQPFYESDKPRPVGVIAVVTEVSDLHRNKVELAEKARSLEMASEIGDLGIFSIDPVTRRISCSPQISEWFGLDDQNVSVMEMLPAIDESDKKNVIETFLSVVHGQMPKHNIIFRIRNQRTGELKFLRSIGQMEGEDTSNQTLSGILQDITRTIKTEKAVEQNARRLQDFISSSPFPIAVYYGREMRVAMANPMLIKTWGKGPDVLGKTYFEILPELEGTGVYENLLKVFDEGISYNAHNQRVDLKVDGAMTVFYFNYSFTPLKDDDGTVYGVLNTAADVTDLNLAKKAAEESEDRYRTLIEESPIGSALYVGPDIRIQHASEVMLQYWGKDKSAIGKTFEEAIPELEGQPFIDFLKAVYKTGKTYKGFQELARLDIGNGLEDFYFNFTYKPLRNSKGAIYAIHHTAVDVTAEVLAKKGLEESEANLRNMISQAPVAICILWGSEYIFGDINPMMETMLGRTARQLEGRHIFDAMPELKKTGLEPILEKAWNGERFVSDEQEFHLPRKESVETFYIKYIYEPLRDMTGEVQGIMVVASDVTQEVIARRKIEEIVASRTQELAEAVESLRQSNAELEQFAYIASHDLQEPLRKISMFTQMLESNLGQLNEKSQHLMDRINNSVGRMTNLIRDILGYSQLSQKNEEFLSVDLDVSVQEAAVDFDELLLEKRGSITVTKLGIIEAVPLQMVQLFGNLISNSLKYSRKDVPPEIVISATKASEDEVISHGLQVVPDGYLKIVFRDNGIGFEQEYADRIFQIFQRLHGKTQYEGTGIGLAMCRKIAENHRGAIYASGKEGKGAEFVMLFPFRQH